MQILMWWDVLGWLICCGVLANDVTNYTTQVRIQCVLHKYIHTH
jgi:hypothetical protein